LKNKNIEMKNILLLIMLTFFFSSYGQTKKETFEYIQNKLKNIALNDHEVQHSYNVDEITNGTKYGKIVVVNASNIHPAVVSAFSPKNFRTITSVEKKESILFEIICDNDSVNLLNKNSDGKTVIWATSSSITFILNKGTEKEEITRLKKAFYHLMKLYGYEKKDLFD
jgi:outer membrane lipoprotein-sorting protein